MAEIRQQYEGMREAVQVWDWISMTDLRTGWYMLTHGVANLREVQSSTDVQLESVTMFPIGDDGILGEVQIGDFANLRPNRWPEVPSGPDAAPLPVKRLQATILHNEFLDALRAEDVDRIRATMRPNTAAAIRSYLTDEYVVLNATRGRRACLVLSIALGAVQHRRGAAGQPRGRIVVCLRRAALGGGGSEVARMPGSDLSFARPTSRPSTRTASSGFERASGRTRCPQRMPDPSWMRPTLTNEAPSTCRGGNTGSSAPEH